MDWVGGGEGVLLLVEGGGSVGCVWRLVCGVDSEYSGLFVLSVLLSSSPHVVLRTGYFSFLVLFGVVLSCSCLSSIASLLLAGEVMTPLPTSMFLMSSSVLLLVAFVLSQSPMLSSSMYSSCIVLHLSSSSSYPSVSLDILHLLNSAFELRTLSSPHL